MLDLGTHQGAVFSPLLFSLVVNPLAPLLKSKGFGVKMGGIQLACLLYADDPVLIADSEERLQKMMNTTTQFLQQWRFVVSARKTQVVAFGRGETRSLKDCVWKIGNKTVHDVRSYKYLGLISEKGGLWKKMQDKKPKQNTNAYIRLDLETPVSKSVNLHFSGTCSQTPKCFIGQKCGPATPKQHYLTLKNCRSKVHEKYSASGPCQRSLAKLP
jgi:hypothetical protein